MIDRLLNAVRGVYPDMPDIVAGALGDMFGRVIAQDEDAAARRALSNRLDVALNGAAGTTGASLVSLVAQVERQQRAVHIVNFDDGMVINFRAPDGRRATLNLSELLDEAARMERDGQVWPIMRDAVADYPSAGPRVPVRETVADAAEKRAAGIKPDDARNLGVQRAPVKP